jgi:acetolactate synthase I/II/III large subunit
MQVIGQSAGQFTGAELITRLIERQGVTVLAGVPGGMSLPLYDALARSRIRHVLARHEQAAGFIAQGLARATGRTGVCFATSGPGVTNLLTAIADAKLDSVPMVAVTGQVPTAMIGTDAFQEVDTYGLTVPITKHNFLVRSAGELLEVIPEAFRIAASGRPGPVLVDVPKDVQQQTIAVRRLPAPGRPDVRPPTDADAVARAAALIETADRPVLLVGAGVVASGAASRLRALADQASIPVAATLHGLGAMPHDHPLFLGMVGMHAARATNLVLEECDLLVALGMRFDDRATGRAADFCPKAGIIHVDIDASELGKIKRPTVGIAADVADFLSRLQPLIRRTPRASWRARVAELRAAHGLRRPGAGDPLPPCGPIAPYGLIAQVAALAPADCIVTSDVGQHQMYVAQAFPFRFPRQWLTSGGLGTMGFGLPAAIGAALARPGRAVVCFSGDGSLLMNLSELATAAEEGVDVKVVLFDNGLHGLVHQQQALFFARRFSADRFRVRPDFAVLARGFGVAAVDLGKASDPAAELALALARRGPCLINAPIAEDELVLPMVPPGAANREMIGGECPAPEIRSRISGISRPLKSNDSCPAASGNSIPRAPE